MYIPTWPGLNPAWFLSFPHAQELPYPLNAHVQTRFFAARYGIYHLVRSLCPNGETVLVPDYHHGNEVLAIRAAGASVRFYPIRADLRPDLSELERLLRLGPRVLFVIHYLGWPQPLRELAALCRTLGVVLIEDCALSLLSESDGAPLGRCGDYAIFCLYKTLPVPNGGLLIQNRLTLPDLLRLPLTPCSLNAAASRSLELMLERLRSHANSLGEALFALKRTVGTVSRSLGVKPQPIGDSGFNPSQLNTAASALSSFLLPRFDYPGIRHRRRVNYQYLTERFWGRATLLLTRLDEGVCPLFFPVVVRHKHTAAKALWQRGIGAVEFWNEGDPEVTKERFPDSCFLREHVLELPIHQDVTDSQMKYLADQVLQLDLL